MTQKRTSGWNKASLKYELDFFNGKSIKAEDAGKYPVYGSNGIIGFSEKFLYQDAIILGRVGAYCGSVKYEPGKFWASDNTIVSKPRKHKTMKFYYYFLTKYPLRSFAGGAAQPLITQTMLKKIEANLPADIIKEKIGEVLWKYDALIQNNTHRIQILESLARLIYDEWFVKFKFPGHEKVKMVDSELGEIPEEWNIGTPRDLISGYISGGWGKDTQEEEFNAPAYVIRGTDFTHILNGNFSHVPLRYHNERNLKLRTLQGFEYIIEISGGSKDQLGVAELQKALAPGVDENIATTLLARPERRYY